MPWVVGIDEAGYGPNLGPFVMASVCCRLPDEHAEADIWRLLRPVVRRHKHRDDGRILIEDSKLVYAPAHGLKNLERGVLATLWNEAAHETNGSDLHLHGWIERFAPPALVHLRDECWYHGRTPMPVHVDAAELRHAAQRFHKTCAALSVAWGPARVVIVCPPRFNAILERGRSKSLVLLLALAELLHHHAMADGDADTVRVFVDKHGGRNRYEDLLREAVPSGCVEVKQEGADCSAYRIACPRRVIDIQFQPRCESCHLPVALASMLAKYVRELLMLEFNHYWRQHLPDLEPTAGYPGDATRFMDAIRPIATHLGIEERALWRQK